MKIDRPYYLNKLKDRMHNGLVKVITGLRRSGKTYLLFVLFKNYLLENGVDINHIIEIQFDQENNKKLLNHKKLLDYIYSKFVDKKRYYILLDEIQYVKKFEPILIQLSRVENVDVYVTGSNSKFLSTDIDTQLNGKNDPIHVYPLSFSEFSSAYSDNEQALSDFMKYGSLPQTLLYSNDDDKKSYIERTFNELYIKDVTSRYRIQYPEQLKEIVKVISSSVGSDISINNIVNTINTLNKTKIKYETISKYIKLLENAFILSSCERYDVKGRRYIGANKKYYFEDIGIKNSLLNYKKDNVSHILENMVYNELINHGYSVNVGSIYTKEFNTSTNKYENKCLEIDFIAAKYDKQYAIQVCSSLDEEYTQKREYRSLNSLKLNCPKIIITLDKWITGVEQNGIEVYNFIDFVNSFFDKHN